MQGAVQFVHEQLTAKKQFPKFKAGDNITVNYKIIEGGKERIQGVERVFPFFSPNIDSILLNKVGKVRRAKLYYLRERSGKSARIKERRIK